MSESHVEEFRAWCEAERAKGLIDIDIFLADSAGITEESVCEELMYMIKSKDIYSDEVL